MDRPLVLEINTRCWLRELSENTHRPVTLATIPDAEFAAWKNFGFTHVWLMGVWTTGPKTREAARARPDLRALSNEAFGADGEKFLESSPYAIADYTAAGFTGGADALAQFRSKLRRYGIGLILDFVPNHLGLDHPWIEAKPGFFVQNSTEKPGTFPVVTANGTIWMAHGKDPYFPAWDDTAQLDYRNPSTRSAMIDVLETVANQCDGVRCDMAMLLLGDVFDKNWDAFPPTATRATGEFWSDAIATVKRRRPGFLFIAEAYWDLEPRLAALGFDYVYDKTFYDLLTRRDSAALEKNVQSAAGRFEPVRFLENHDEPRIASLLPLEQHKAAATLLMRQPGMRLLHDGQLIGRKRRLPVQFTRYWPEPPDPDIAEFYRALLCDGNSSKTNDKDYDQARKKGGRHS